MAKIAINGFGRIGRMFFRQAFGMPGIEIVAINDLGDLENLAYLLTLDSVYGRYGKRVAIQGGNMVIDGTVVRCTQEKDPTKLPWKELGVDIVIEATGIFESFEKAKVHLDAGAKRVVLTAPAKDADGTLGKTILVGINEEKMKEVKISSTASCTTNSAAPVMQILSKNPGIERAILNTVHAYTATQSIVDSPAKGKDFRRGRAAAQNISPSTTGAAIAVSRTLPDLVGKFDGIAIRVPAVTGSIADITFVAKRKTTVEEINDILTKAAASEQWKGIMGVTTEQVVSTDIIGQPFGAIVDLNFTKVVDGTLVKVLSWYDNEWGYVSTLIRHVQAAAQLV